METAIDWFIREINELNMKDYLSKKMYLGRRFSAEDTAREIFKEQINQAYMNGLIDAKNKKPKNYFKETYESH